MHIALHQFRLKEFGRRYCWIETIIGKLYMKPYIRTSVVNECRNMIGLLVDYVLWYSWQSWHDLVLNNVQPYFRSHDEVWQLHLMVWLSSSGLV